jgi:hypothetical protein
MGDMKRRPSRMVWSLLLAAAACLASGAAVATCTPSLSGIPYGVGDVPCYVVVQPIDVCLSNGGACAPFNTTATIGNSSGAGTPTNETSPNPIGFTVNPTTGVSPSPSGGVDITRVLLNNIGVDLMWNPMVKFPSPSTKNFTTLTVTQGATCTGSISGTTLTIASCSSGVLAVSDSLSGTGISGTTITASGIVGGAGTYTGVGGAGTYKISKSLGNLGSRAITATSSLLQSQDFLTLSQQAYPTPPATTPCPISKMTIPATSPCGSPAPPASATASDINMFFVSKLNPPASGGTLYGFSWLGHNGIAIAGNTFFAPTPLQARPDTIAHELGHNLGLDHSTYGAGPWAVANNGSSYTAPAGVAPPIPASPLAGECDPSYPACGANLMTTGSLRTEPTVACVLAAPAGGGVTTPASCLTTSGGQTIQLPGLYTATADQVTPLPIPPFQAASQAQLPMSQQAQVLGGMSGLLLPEPSIGSASLPTFASGFVQPIPHETTTAQVGTGGSSTDRVIFNLSGPAGGRPGETLVAWILTLPPGQTFARHGRFHVVAQSREDLVQDVTYYPDSENDSILKDIAYRPGGDKDSGNPNIDTAADSPCASATAECLMVKFQLPGLGAHDSISLSNSILKSVLFSKGVLSDRGAPITNNDLCKSKITYIFSDGYATTSNFGRCPAVSLPLVSSSWRPDPTVSPRKIKTDVLLAQRGVVLAAAAPATAVQKPGPVSDPTNDPPPAGAILDLSGTPIPGGGNGTYQMYSVNFTAPVNQYQTAITFAFREDPAFISFSNASVTDLMGGDNLLTNGDFSGGTYPNSGNNSTPNHWTYANIYGASFGGVVASGCGVGGTGFCWYDGAVQAYDAISQTINTTPGHVYKISFLVADNSNCGTDGGSPCNFSDVSTNGNTTDTGGNGINVTVYAQPGLPPANASMPCTPDPNNPGQCLFQVTQTGLEDADPKTEGGQLGRSCNNSTASGTDVSGTINGNVTISAGQQCNFKAPCEITGNLTINGDPTGVLSTGVWLGCTLDGNLTDNSGNVVLAPSASVKGNVQISGASAFSLGPSLLIDGNLQIHNVPGTQLGTVCGTTVKGNLTVQNNTSRIEIGGTTPQICAGNTVSGNLQCTGNNPPPTSGSNTVSGHNQCSG